MPVLATKESCTGCTACASICPVHCIAMIHDENGFPYPSFDSERCVACGLCEKTCPVITPLKIEENEPEAYAAYIEDESIRSSSSSGGVFTALARAVLAEQGAVFGAAYDARFAVKHVCIEREEELEYLRGAKYAQSDLRDVFPEVKRYLNLGRKVLFSGTPCQAGGLKAYLRKEYPNLILADFVCHSVPAPAAWEKYVQYRAERDNAGRFPIAVNLRSKKTGWSKYQYSNLFTYENGIEHAERSGESLYMKLFVGGYLDRPSCADCRFGGYQRVSDITLGDFWGIWDIAPDMDDNKGTSVVLVHSPKGAELFKTAMSDGTVVRQVTLEQASRQNGAMIAGSKRNEKREEALQAVRNNDFEKCRRMLEPGKSSLRARVKHKVKSLFAGNRKAHA